MGQSQSNLEQSKMSVPKINTLQLLKQVNDIRYGDIKIYKLQDGHTIAVQDHVFHDEQQWFNFKQQAEQNFKAFHEVFLIQMIDLQHVTEKELCTQMTQAHSVYEYFDEYLDKVISEQSASKQCFEEIEIVAMIYCTLVSIQHLSEQQKYHGDIRPITISVTSHAKRSPYRKNEPFAIYKLTDIQELTDMNAFRRCVTKQQGSYNLSPEQLQFLKQKVLKPTYDLNKSDVFSIGLTALQMATLNSLYDIYDLQNYILHTDKLDNYIREMKTQYSEQLSTLICHLLQLAPENRPNSYQAQKYIIGYRLQLDDYFRQSTSPTYTTIDKIDKGYLDQSQNQVHEQILVSKVVDTTELFEQMEIIEQRAKVALQRSQDAQIKYQKSPGKSQQKQTIWEPTKSYYLYNNLTPITQKELHLSDSKQDIPSKTSSFYLQNAPKYQQKEEVAEYEYDQQEVDEKQLKQNVVEPIEITTSNIKQTRTINNNIASFSQQQLFESINTDQQKYTQQLNEQQQQSRYNQQFNDTQQQKQNLNDSQSKIYNYTLQNSDQQTKQYNQQTIEQTRTYNQQSYYQKQQQESETRLSQQLRDKELTKKLTGFDQQQQNIYPQMEYQQPIESFDAQQQRTQARPLNRQLTGSMVSRKSIQQQ